MEAPLDAMLQSPMSYYEPAMLVDRRRRHVVLPVHDINLFLIVADR